MVGSLLCSRTGGEDHVARRAKRPLTGEVLLRDVRRGDLRSFFEHQLDPEASRMAGFPTRNRKSFLAHWDKVLGDESVVKQTILFDGEVAGNVVSFLHADEREVCVSKSGVHSTPT
jgi:hypothetical protein